MPMMRDPVHPGEVLDELYLKPLDMSAIALAKKLHVPRTRIERLVRCQTGISASGWHVFSTGPGAQGSGRFRHRAAGCRL